MARILIRVADTTINGSSWRTRSGRSGFAVLGTSRLNSTGASSSNRVHVTWRVVAVAI